MKLRYGTYTHDTGEATVAISRDPILNEAGEIVELRERWDVSGFLQAPSPSELTSKIEALRNAYSVNGRNLSLIFDNGTATAHSIKTALTSGGTRVVSGPNFPIGDGAEYSTFRSYSIALEAILKFSNGESLISWQQTLTLIGGGPRFVHLQTLRGLPRKQFTAQSTPYRATQTGSAVGRFGYPPPAAPLFPADEQVDKRIIRPASPKRIGSGAYLDYTDYRIDWTYSFESDSPLNGLPGRWVPQ